MIGAHVSTGGGLVRAVERGVERGCAAIQIFHQSPRMWRPTRYGPADYEAFREALSGSGVRAVAIHAVYLVNCASRERQTRARSITSLTHALQVGDGIGAAGVVLHAGARKGEPHGASMKRAARAIAECLAESESCRLLLENTAGTQGPLGRNFDELAELLELLGDEPRAGICLDCCHLLASGYEVRTPDSLADVLDEFDRKVGLERLLCLHVNDSKVPLGANRDRHANLGEGELGASGIATFLSEPRFEGLPALIETPGPDKHGPDLVEVETAKRLRKRGLRARRRGSGAERKPSAPAA